MEVCIYHNKFVTKETNTFNFHFTLPKDLDKNLNHEIDHIVKRNEFRAK